MDKENLLREVKYNMTSPASWLDPYDSEKINNRYLRGVSKRISYFSPSLFYKTNLFEKRIWSENYILLGHAALNLRDKESVEFSLQQLEIYKKNFWGLPINWHSGKYTFPIGTLMSTTTSEAILFFCEVYEVYEDLIDRNFLINSAENLISTLNRNGIDETSDYLYSYTPMDNYKVFNSNLLVAAAIGTAGKLTGNLGLINEATKIFETCEKYIPAKGYVPYKLGGAENTADSYHQLFSMRAAFYLRKYNIVESDLLRRMEKYFFEKFHLNNVVVLRPNSKVLDLQPYSEALRYFGLSNDEKSYEYLYKFRTKLMKKNNYIQRVWRYNSKFPIKSNVCHSRQGYFRLLLALSYRDKL